MFKDLRKIHIFLLAGILLAYFISRIGSISNYPIFTDEAIYLRWSQIAKNDASWRFISLTDGKQPLYIWAAIASMRFFRDPIIAGRMVAVFSGFLTIIALVLLGKVIFNKWGIGILAGFLYLIFPMALVYDRIALMDGLLAMLMTWTLLLEFIYIKTLRLDIALLLGGMIGFSALTKTSGFLALYLLPLFLIMFNWNKQKIVERLGKWLGLSLVASGVAAMFYAVLRLSPFFYIIAQKDRTFLYSFSEWLTHPFDSIYGNADGLWNWVHIYLTWPWVIVLLIGLFWGRKYLSEKLILLGWFLAPLGGLAVFGRVLYPRFIFFCMVPLLLLIAYSLNKIAEKVSKGWIINVGLIFIISLLPISIDYSLITNPKLAKIPGADSTQYYNYWPSGYGIKESINYFQEKAKTQKIAVYTEGTFGLLPAALEMYLSDNKNITVIKGLWPIPDKPPKEVMDNVSKMPTYIVFFQNPPPPAWKLIEIAKYQKGITPRYQYLYKIEP